MRTYRMTALALLVVSLFCVMTRGHAQSPTPRYEKSECDFPLPALYPRDLVRECGFLTVPESRGRPNARPLRLAVVIYRAQQPDGSPPLLLLHGGPGGAGGTRFPWSEVQFPLARKRDVITFDNRGVSRSEPRFCPDFDEKGSAAFNLRAPEQWEAAYRDAVRACVASMDAQGIDRTAFGADVNAADAVDLRRALDIAQWDIYGVSYGGLVAQELLRVDPRGTHSASLISTISPGAKYHADRALDYQLSIDRVFAQCRAQPPCATAFPSLAEDFDALYQEFTANPVEIPVPGANPARTVRVNGDRLVLELRGDLSTPASIARLPLVINELRRGDRTAQLRRLIGRGIISSWGPEGRVIQCNEYGAQYRASVAAIVPRLRAPFRFMADDFREHCDIWLPKLVSRADTTPVASDVPTLIVHGEYDVGDPADIQRAIGRQLSKAYAHIFTGETHANPPFGCHGLIVQQFLKDPARAPDASCIAHMPAIRFKTTSLQPTIMFTIATRAAVNTPFAGTWEARLGGGPDWTLMLDTDGKTVTGNVPERMIAVFDGTIVGETIKFSMKSPDGMRTITLTGKLQGDSIGFTREVSGPPGGAPAGMGLFGGPGLREIKAVRIRP